MILDIPSLRVFAAVVEQGSFAAAAGDVHRSQPAITQRIQKLETLIGKSLFSREGRSKRLTEDGLKLYDYARRILALHDEACEAMSPTALSGDVRLGTPDDATETILPMLLKKFSAAYPNVRVIIHVARSAFLMQALKQGEIDMAVSTSDEPTVPRRILRSVPTVWIGAGDYRLDSGLPLPLVLHDEPSLYRRLAIEALERRAIPYKVNFISPSLAGIRSAVRAGLGITVRSTEMLGPEFRVLPSGEGLPDLPEVPFYLYASSFRSNPVARRMLETTGQPVPSDVEVVGRFR